MKKSTLSIAIGSVFAVGMGGCTSPQDDVGANLHGTPATEVTASSGNSAAEKTAQMNIAVRFPSKGDAQSAVIDVNAGSIDVRIRRIPWGDWQAAKAAMQEHDCNYTYNDGSCSSWDYDSKWSNYLGNQNDAASLTLTPDAPSGSVDLYPGQAYLVQAFQRSDSGGYYYYNDYDHDALIAGSSSIAILGQGSNNLVLNMLHGSWDVTSVNGTAQTSFELALLNRTDEIIDMDPDVEGVQPIDFDPSTPDVVETAADVLGLNGQLQGLHLFGKRPFLTHFGHELAEVFGRPTNGDPSQQHGDDDDLNPAAVTGAGYAGVWRTTDGTTGAAEMLSITEPTGYYDDVTGVELWAGMKAGGIIQSFSGGTNSNELNLGDWVTEIDQRDPITGNHIGSMGAGLMTLTKSGVMMDDGPASDDFGVPINDGITHSYTMGDDIWNVHTDNRSSTVPNGNGGYESRTFVTARVDKGTNITMQYPVVIGEKTIDQYAPSMAQNGTTLDVTLIEFVDIFGGESNPAVGVAPAAPLDLNAMAGVAAVSSAPNSRMEGLSRSVLLNKTARDMGLMAQAAGGFAGTANCLTLTGSEDRHNTEYLWENNEWVAGSWNDSYFYEFGGYYWNPDTQSEEYYSSVAAGEDRDGDGAAAPFETAFINDVLEQSADWMSQSGFGEVCDPLPSPMQYVVQCQIDTALVDEVDPNNVDATILVARTPGPYVLPIQAEPVAVYVVVDGLPTADVDYYEAIDGATLATLDLDGDKRIERYEAQYQYRLDSGNIEVCMHELTLSGKQLTHIVTGGVAIE